MAACSKDTQMPPDIRIGNELAKFPKMDAGRTGKGMVRHERDVSWARSLHGLASKDSEPIVVIRDKLQLPLGQAAHSRQFWLVDSALVEMADMSGLRTA